MKTYLCLVSLVASLGCSEKKATTQLPTKDSVKSTVDTVESTSTRPLRSEVSSSVKSVSPTQAGKWIYKESVSEAGAKTHTASSISADVLKFDPPFNGGSTVTLTLRNRNGSTTLLLGVSAGQFTSSFQGGKVRIAFDGNPSTVYSFSAASNGNTDVIFFDAAETIINKMKAAKKMVVLAGFYGQGVRQIEFQTAGLKWPY